MRKGVKLPTFAEDLIKDLDEGPLDEVLERAGAQLKQATSDMLKGILDDYVDTTATSVFHTTAWDLAHSLGSRFEVQDKDAFVARVKKAAKSKEYPPLRLDDPWSIFALAGRVCESDIDTASAHVIDEWMSRGEGDDFYEEFVVLRNQEAAPSEQP